jgi:hypothetical protein
LKTTSKHKNKQKTYVLKESDIKKLKRDITKDISAMAIMIFLAWLKDAEYIDNLLSCYPIDDYTFYSYLTENE